MKKFYSANDLKETFFFDLPLCDVYSAACTALRMIYYGSEGGFFNKKKKDPLPLDGLAALQVVLNHRSVVALSDKYSYHLVYYPKEIGDIFLKEPSRKIDPVFSKLTRQVKLSKEPSIKPNRVRKFYVPSCRPIHIANCFDCARLDSSVPSEYLKSFGHMFSGLLMRCESGFPLAETLFAAQGLHVSEQRPIAAVNKGSQCVITYTSEKAIS